jgi:hypothetical protein
LLGYACAQYIVKARSWKKMYAEIELVCYLSIVGVSFTILILGGRFLLRPPRERSKYSRGLLFLGLSAALACGEFFSFLALANHFEQAGRANGAVYYSIFSGENGLFVLYAPVVAVLVTGGVWYLIFVGERPRRPPTQTGH